MKGVSSVDIVEQLTCCWRSQSNKKCIQMWRPLHNINHCIDGLRLDKLAPFTFRVVLWICLNKNIQLNQLHLPIMRHQSAATCNNETKRTKQCYCQALYFNNPPKLMPDQTKRALLKPCAHTGQCTPTHLHKSFLSKSLNFKVSIDLLALVSPPSFPRLKLHSLHSKSFFYPP